MAFYLNLGLGWDVGLSLYLDFVDMDCGLHLDVGVRGFESGFCFFWGVGSVYLKLSFVCGVGLVLL